MNQPNRNVAHIDMGTMKLEIHFDRKAADAAAAEATAEELLRLGQLGITFGVVFATGATQRIASTTSSR